MVSCAVILLLRSDAGVDVARGEPRRSRRYQHRQEEAQRHGQARSVVGVRYCQDLHRLPRSLRQVRALARSHCSFVSSSSSFVVGWSMSRKRKRLTRLTLCVCRFVDGETTELRSRGKRHKFDPAIQETGKERASSLKLLDRVLGPDQPTIDTDKVRSSACCVWEEQAEFVESLADKRHSQWDVSLCVCMCVGARRRPRFSTSRTRARRLGDGNATRNARPRNPRRASATETTRKSRKRRRSRL